MHPRQLSCDAATRDAKVSPVTKSNQFIISVVLKSNYFFDLKEKCCSTEEVTTQNIEPGFVYMHYTARGPRALHPIKLTKQ